MKSVSICPDTYPELCDALLGRHHKPYTRRDTEILPHSYEEVGFQGDEHGNRPPKIAPEHCWPGARTPLGAGGERPTVQARTRVFSGS